MTQRILFLDHTAALGGGEIALLRLLRVLDRSRFEPVVVLFEDGPLVSELRSSGMDVRVLPLSSRVTQTRKDSLGTGSLFKLGALWDVVTFSWRLSRLIRQINPALVHTNSLKSDLIGGVASRLAFRKVVWHVRDRIVPEYLPGKVVKVFRFLCRWMPTMVVTNSQATLETLNAPARSNRYRVVHDGTHLPPNTTELPLNPIKVGLVGRISPWKGQHVFLKAIAKIRERFPAVRFQIIGSALFNEADYEREIRALCADLGLADSVEFTGFQSDVEQIMSSLTLLVHASTIGEPFGQVVIEAMAAARPLIATRGGGVPEIVEDSRTGLLVPMGDVDALAAAMTTLLSDTDRMRQMGAAGRERVSESFTIERTARNLEAVFDHLLPPAPSRNPSAACVASASPKLPTAH